MVSLVIDLFPEIRCTYARPDVTPVQEPKMNRPILGLSTALVLTVPATRNISWFASLQNLARYCQEAS